MTTPENIWATPENAQEVTQMLIEAGFFDLAMKRLFIPEVYRNNCYIWPLQLPDGRLVIVLQPLDRLAKHTLQVGYDIILNQEQYELVLKLISS